MSAWQPPFPSGVPMDVLEQEVRRSLAESTAGWRDKYPQVELRHEIIRGHPVQVLTQAAEYALALVVGSRGLGGFPGLLLGSVSQGALHHARCPLIVVPHHAD